MYPAIQRDDIDLQAYLVALGDDLADVLADASRTLLVNVDPAIVPVPTAEAIGAIVRAMMGALPLMAGQADGVIEVSCGENRDGGLTLVVTDESGHASPGLASQGISDLVAYFGTRMMIETDNRLRCTVTIPAQFTV